MPIRLGNKGICPAKKVTVRIQQVLVMLFVQELTIGLTYRKMLSDAVRSGTKLASVDPSSENVCPHVFTTWMLGLDMDVSDC